MKPHRIPEAELRQVVATSHTITEAMGNLGLSVGGGEHHRRFEQRLRDLGIDFSHFDPGRNRPRRPGQSLALVDLLIRDSPRTLNSRLKKRLIKEGLLEPICQKCGLEPEWQGDPLTLQLDHINGEGRDHRLENLRLLCPNCHSQTPTFAGRNKRRLPRLNQPSRKDACPECGGPKDKRCPLCRTCTRKGQERIAWPDDIALRAMIWERPVTDVAKVLGISGNAIRKRCRKRGITTPPRGYWQKKRAAGKDPH